jgi:hypothetical protein
MNDTAQLTFHIVSPENNVKREFAVTYQLEAIPDSVIQRYNPSYREKSLKESAERMKQQNPQINISSKLSDEEKDMYKRIENALKQRKYMPLFKQIRSDGIYIFLVKSDTEIGSKKYIVTVINSESGKEVSRFITSESISSLDIFKNGYRYKNFTPKDGYPVVQKYRINPAVYGK